MAELEEDRIVTNQPTEADKEIENTLRPESFDDYIGQEQTKENVRIAIEAAQKRGESLDHILISGVSGLGKTTLALIIAKEMDAQIKTTSGPAIERTGDLVSLLTNLENGDVLFIDEIHRLPRVVEEVLYSAMEDYQVDIVLGKGPSARSLQLDLPEFTLIGATTKVGSLSSPLRNRFGSRYKLDFYSLENIKEIIQRSAEILDVDIEGQAAMRIAEASRRTPRIANRLLKRVRDFAEVENEGVVDKKMVESAFERLAIDSKGLDEMDRKILKVLLDRYEGGPAGLKTIAAAIAEDKDTIEEVYEPHLLRIGFIQRTAKGRKATHKARQHLDNWTGETEILG